MHIYIYKIYNDDMAYIGSTKNFKQRMRSHKNSCYNEKSKGYNCFIYQYIRTRGGWDVFDKDIIYECDVKDKDEQRKVEQEWIKNNECKLNGYNSYTSVEERKEQKKQYYEQNKEKLKEQSKQYYEQNKEQKKQYYEQNKDKIKEQSKQQYEQNKDKIKERKKQYSQQKVNCPNCNLEMNKSSLLRHIKSKHI